MKYLKKIIIILFLCVLLSLLFSACNNNSDNGREPYFPESGAYKIMLKPDEWAVVANEQNADRLIVLNQNAGVVITVDGYEKSDLSGLSVSDIDSFIKFYKTFESVKGAYENENNTVDELKSIDEKDLKNAQLKSGKRQIVYVKSSEDTAGQDLVTEYIYVETEGHFFAISYGVFKVYFTEEVQNAVNDLAYHIRTE